MDLDAATRFPFAADDRRWMDTALVGTLLLETIPLVVPAVLLAGYLVRLLRADDAPPKFEDVGSLMGDGVRAAVVVLTYHLPILSLAGWGTGRPPGAMAASSLSFATQPPAALASHLWPPRGSLVVTVAVALLYPLCGYVSSVALRRYAADGLAAAFALDAVRCEAMRAATVRRWLRCLGVGFVGGLLALAAGAVPFVGQFAAASVAYFALVVAVALWSRTDAERHANHASTQKSSVGATDEDVAEAVVG